MHQHFLLLYSLAEVLRACTSVLVPCLVHSGACSGTTAGGTAAYIPIPVEPTSAWPRSILVQVSASPATVWLCVTALGLKIRVRQQNKPHRALGSFSKKHHLLFSFISLIILQHLHVSWLKDLRRHLGAESFHLSSHRWGKEAQTPARQQKRTQK